MKISFTNFGLSLVVVGATFLTSSCARYQIKGGDAKHEETLNDDPKPFANPQGCTPGLRGNEAICESTDGEFNVSANPYETGVGQNIAFKGVCRNNATNIRIQWDFGDGGKAEGFQVIHPYGQIGRFTVRANCFENNKLFRNGSLEINIISRGYPGGGGVGGGDPGQSNPHQN